MMNDDQKLIHMSQYTMKNFDVINDFVNNTVYMTDSE